MLWPNNVQQGLDALTRQVEVSATAEAQRAVDSTSQDTARPNSVRQQSVNLLDGTQQTGKDAKGKRHKWQPIPIDQCEKLERIPRATF